MSEVGGVVSELVKLVHLLEGFSDHDLKVVLKNFEFLF